MDRRPYLVATLILFCALVSIVGTEAWLRRQVETRAARVAAALGQVLDDRPTLPMLEKTFLALCRTSGFDYAELWRGSKLLFRTGEEGGHAWGSPIREERMVEDSQGQTRIVVSRGSLRWWLHGLSLMSFGLLALAVGWGLKKEEALRRALLGRNRQEESGQAAAIEALRNRLGLSDLLQKILSALREAPAEDVDGALRRALEGLGRSAAADRAFIFQFSHGGTRFGYTHGWASPGLRDGAMEGMENLPGDTFAWWLGQLREKGTLNVADVNHLPADASAERYLLSLKQVKSFVAVPLRSGGEWLGFCGLSRVRETKAFRSADVEMLEGAAGSLASLIARAGGELRAKRLYVMENLLAQTAKRFVAPDSETLDAPLGAALADLGRFCGAQRCSLALTQGDGMRLVLMQEWVRAGTPAGPRDGRTLAAGGLPRLMEALKTEGNWNAPAVENLDLQNEAEKVELQRRGAKSALAVALRHGGHVQGFLLLENLTSTPFEPDSLDCGSAVADILASALRRQQVEIALRASEERTRVLLTGLPDALLRFSKDGRILDARLPKGDKTAVGELLGQDLGRLAGQVPGLPPAAIPVLRQALQNCLRTGHTQSLDLRQGDDPSQARFLEARFVPTNDQEALLLLRDRTVERRRDQEHDKQLGNLLAIFNAGSRGLLLLDHDGGLQAFNHTAQERTLKMLGWSLQAGASFFEGLHADVRAAMQAPFQSALKGQEPELEIEYPLEGEAVWRFRAQFLPVFGEDSAVRSVCLSLEYLDELQKVEEALKESEDRYILAAKGSNDGLWDLDLKRGGLFVSERWEAQAGLDAGQGPKTLDAWMGLAHPEDRQALRERLNAHLDGRTNHFEAEHRLKHHERGDYRWVLLRGLAVRDSGGKAVRAAGSQTDIELSKSREGSLLKDALQDPLTGLPNRALVLDRLGRCLARSKRRKGYSFGALFLDTDNFKAINQSMGHVAGDALLKQLAGRLETALRPGDTVGRLGGDEFAVILDDLAKRDDALLVAKRILKDCEQPFNVMGQDVYATVSIGIALGHENLKNSGELLRDAETAMVQSKAQGRSQMTVFEPGMHQAAVSRIDLESGLRKALSEGQLTLYYQPLVRLSDGQLLGFEALARWIHPERGLILPGDFIPAAEESGLILPLGRLVLRQGLQALADWGKEGRGLKLSVNLSPRQLEDPELLGSLDEALKATGVGAERLQLEVTESVLMSNRQAATRALEALKSRGVGIAIDDFGTGYSSLSYLHQFPAETLKIDRAFVSRMDGSSANEAVTGAIITLGLNLGLELVGEGIETEMQARRLKTLGCQVGQGYWFAKPMPEAQARECFGKRFKVPEGA